MSESGLPLEDLVVGKGRDLTGVRDLSLAHGVIEFKELLVCQPFLHQPFFRADHVFHRDDHDAVIFNEFLLNIDGRVDADNIIAHNESPLCSI